jgi:hypothetical protein
MKDVRRVAVFMHQNTFLIWRVMTSGVELYQRLLFVSHASFKQRVNASSGFGANYMLDGG